MAKAIPTPIADKIRKAFIDYYVEKGHAQIPNVSLVPNVDSTLLFTNSGMFPLVPYLSGQPHPLGKRIVNFQRCIRTGEKDLAEIGDWKHTTMFEMMGNWSLGDYFKAEQIPWVFKLYVDTFGLDPKRIYVSVFAGDEDAPRDEEAIALWKKAYAEYGIEAELAPVMFETVDGKERAYEIDINGQKIYRDDWSMEANPNQRIFMYGKKENWWQRGEAAGELGGPDSEIFFETGSEHDVSVWGQAHPNSDSPRFLEIGNSVFMQYKLNDELKWEELPQKNVDFGGGFSRILVGAQGANDIFSTEIFTPIIYRIEEVSGKSYLENGKEYELTKYFRIIADHVFGSTFIIADGVEPGNKEQGYILKRFIRRAIRMGKRLGIEQNFLSEIAEIVLGLYERHYDHLAAQEERIRAILTAEEDKFRRTLQQGVRELQKLSERLESKQQKLTGKDLFFIYETYGFPFELSLEELKLDGDQKVLQEEFKTAESEHKSASRTGAEAKFTGGLADSSAETTRLHTAHHLLLRALQMVLGDHVHQRGSNITAERLRIDFSHPEKITPEQKSEIEKLVNEAMQKEYRVLRLELAKTVAENLGAEMEFGQKYGDVVSVYVMGDVPADLQAQIEAAAAAGESAQSVLDKYEVFSMEFCGGPHVENTKVLKDAGTFRIIKEESSGAGVRRIKATIS